MCAFPVYLMLLLTFDLRNSPNGSNRRKSKKHHQIYDGNLHNIIFRCHILIPNNFFSQFQNPCREPREINFPPFCFDHRFFSYRQKLKCLSPSASCNSQRLLFISRKAKMIAKKSVYCWEITLYRFSSFRPCCVSDVCLSEPTGEFHTSESLRNMGETENRTRY